LVDTQKNVVTKREGEFFSTGLQIIDDQVYFSSEEKVYKLIGDRVTELDEKIAEYMKDEHYAYIFRMEQYKGDLVLMLFRKGNYALPEYGFVKYDLDSGELETVLGPGHFPNPSNFFMQEKGISVTSMNGFIFYEKFFPRSSYAQMNTNQGAILDTWIDKDDIYYVINKDTSKYVIYRNKIGTQVSDLGEKVAGGFTGFTDGVADEVRMDYATDFSWDGSGFLFSDRDNNAIRKLWIDSRPLNIN
jgi:hypothetical protein